MKLTIDLVYHSPAGDKVTVAKLKDAGVILEASRRAIQEAKLKAKTAGEFDPILGDLLEDEATRAARALELLVPGL